MALSPALDLLASALSLAFSTPHSIAQQVGPEAEKDLGAVTVSAERSRSYKSNSVQVGSFRDVASLDAPQTSNVVTRVVLDAQGATNLFGALRNSAGVTRSPLNGSTYDNVAIRGVLVENRGNYRLNGSLSIINLVDSPLENKERVDVLKGASSLYYGFVPPSGIVNLVTKRASKDPVTSFAMTANQHGGMSAHADIGRRFGEHEQFGARINLVTGREDSGVNRYSGNRQLASAALDWKVTRDLSFKPDLEHYRKDVSEQPAIALLPAVSGKIALPEVPDNKRNLAGEWQTYDAQATNVLLRTDYRLADNWSVLLEGGRAKTERERDVSQFQNYNLTTGAGILRTFFNRGQEWGNTNYRTELLGVLPGSWMSHELTLGFTRNDRDAVSISNGRFDTPQNLDNPIDIGERSPTELHARAPHYQGPRMVRPRSHRVR